MVLASQDLLTGENDLASVTLQVDAAREAQRVWRQWPIDQRLAIVRRVRHHLARHVDQWIASVPLAQRSTSVETLAAEVIPLASACRWLERHARRLLRPRREGLAARWLGWLIPALQIEVSRVPYGVVLIIGTWNYPLLLTGVQALQALVAGNAVLIKPGGGSGAAGLMLQRALYDCGLPAGLCGVLSEQPQDARQAINHGVDRIVLTGSAATGQAVAQQAAQHGTPCTLELSGCDAVFVLADADVERAARCIAFGLRWNGSATCIAPRRVFVHQRVADSFRSRLQAHVEQLEPLPLDPRAADAARQHIRDALQQRATLLVPQKWSQWTNTQRAEPVVLEVAEEDLTLLRADLFAPVLSIQVVRDEQHAVQLDRLCPYALGAAIFGSPGHAQRLARELDAGCITINDLIAPTADPRVPFGGTRRSGYGVTRGAEGLLEMTRVKSVATRHGRWLAHLEPLTPNTAQLLTAALRCQHGATWRERIRAARDLCRALGARSSSVDSQLEPSTHTKPSADPSAHRILPKDNS